MNRLDKIRFVKYYLRLCGVDKKLEHYVLAAYEVDYDIISDGITGFEELQPFKKLGLKHPAGVMHDYLYSRGLISRKTCDEMFGRLLRQMGHPCIGYLFQWGVRLLGKKAWKRHKLSRLQAK